MELELGWMRDESRMEMIVGIVGIVGIAEIVGIVGIVGIVTE